ncbi:hypothetical protein [Mesorhizobium sp. CAU 1732]|uniref:hypothetical protein n=1 Tax=Mesorhizobium sp. CAU 1732 TaxID=3140358 RepID=UPI003260062B
MDWKRAIEQERAALGGIVALLLSLADLAERIAGRSTAIASLVLWFLRQAEAVARDFVDGSDAPLPLMPIVPPRAGPLDAMRLALSLRALARQIDGQARRFPATRRRIGCDPAASPPGRAPALRAALASLSRLAAFALGALLLVDVPDTS